MGEGMKPFLSITDVLKWWDRTPRSAFAISEDYINGSDTYPPIWGVVFQTQTLTSFRASKVQGVLHLTACTFHSIVYSLTFSARGGVT
jgi:hypothetical protein